MTDDPNSPVAPEGIEQIAAAIRAYMSKSMAMPDYDSDQEQNWIYGHMVTLAAILLRLPRVDDGGVAVTQKLHSAECRRQEDQRMIEALGLELKHVEKLLATETEGGRADMELEAAPILPGRNPRTLLITEDKRTQRPLRAEATEMTVNTAVPQPASGDSSTSAPEDHDCVDWNSGGACFICRRPLSIEEQNPTEGLSAAAPEAPTMNCGDIPEAARDYLQALIEQVWNTTVRHRCGECGKGQVVNGAYDEEAVAPVPCDDCITDRDIIESYMCTAYERGLTPEMPEAGGEVGGRLRALVAQLQRHKVYIKRVDDSDPLSAIQYVSCPPDPNGGWVRYADLDAMLSAPVVSPPQEKP